MYIIGEYRRLVVDVGYGGTKYGMAGRAKPKFLRNTRDDEDGQYQVTTIITAILTIQSSPYNPHRNPHHATLTTNFQVCISERLLACCLQHAITRNKLDYMKTDWELMENLWEWMFDTDLEVIKMMNFVFKTRSFASKTRNCVLKIDGCFRSRRMTAVCCPRSRHTVQSSTRSGSPS